MVLIFSSSWPAIWSIAEARLAISLDAVAFRLISMRLERFLVIVYLGALAFNLLFCWQVIPQTPLWGAALAIIFTKGGMALVTFGFIQRRLRVFPWEDVLVLMVTGLASASLYWGSLFVLRRGWALLVAVLALFGLLWYFWRIRAPLKKLKL